MNKQREFHPIANIFPMMSPEEFAELRKDIQQNGQLEPVWLHADGRIIDGRNRYKACMELGITPKYRTWDGSGSLTQFVVSLNLHRRHLSAMQRAAVAVDILPMLEAEAKERQAHGMTAPGKTLVENFPQAFDAKGDALSEKLARTAHVYGIDARKSRSQAAAIVGTNDRYVSDAKRYKEQAPEVFEMARNGTVNGNEANKLARMPEDKRTIVISQMKSSGQRLADAIKETKSQLVPPAPLPHEVTEDTKYRVIYADPPWRYGNTMPDYFDEQGDHYPLMSPTEIAELPIKQMAQENAVLFLWVTSPILEESFHVVNSWGFKYKASFVWDKVKHNMGHYNSVRHELLLICTRGSCQPDVQKLFDSVQSIERTNRHSEKPNEFREIIDTIYPYGARIELFARKPHEGWVSWGNEVAA